MKIERESIEQMRVGAFDPNNPNKEPSEMVTITTYFEGRKHYISMESAQVIDDLIKYLEDAKQEAWQEDTE